MIPFNNLYLQYAAHRGAIDSAVTSVLESGTYILGKNLSTFEREFAAYIGVNYCVGVASGTEAIALSLMALGVGQGDEVVTSNLTAFPTITGIMQAGAVPVVADISLQDGLIDCRSVEERLTSSTRAIIPVHLYGQCCDMDALLELAGRRNIPVVEDAAQAAGSTYKGKKAGSMGVCGAFSFYPTKNLGAFGDGGAVATNHESVYKRLLALRNYGQGERYYHETFGINSRLDELQAAVLLAKLERLDGWNDRRRVIASYYRQHLTAVHCLTEHDYGATNNHLFVVRHPQRGAVMKHLESRGVRTLIHYPVPVNRQKAFPGSVRGDCPASETFAREIFSLPMYPELTDEQVAHLVEALNDCGG